MWVLLRRRGTHEVGDGGPRQDALLLLAYVRSHAYYRCMKLLQVIVGVALPLLAFLLFAFDDGWAELLVRALIVVAGIAQAFITYRTVTSAAQARPAQK